MFFFSLGIFIFPLKGHSQSKKFISTYNAGYQAFNQEKFGSAIQLFREVIGLGEAHPLLQQAHLYAAFAAYKAQDWEQARQLFQVTLQEYPSIKERDEIYYALADIAFRNQNQRQALQHLNQIQSPGFQPDIQRMVGYYISQMEILELRLLQQNLPQDTLIAQILVDKLAASSDQPEDMYFVQDLMSELNLQDPPVKKIEKVVYTRQPYKVAAVLPIDLEDFKHRDTTRLGRIGLHMYQGMRLAKQELDSNQQASIELYAYDLGSDETATLSRWISSGEFDDIDLVVGPLFDKSYRQMAQLAGEKKFTIINPLSVDDNLLLNKFSYLYQPSTAMQAEQAATYVASNYRNKSTLILFDNLPRNQQMAEVFRQKAEALGLKVLAFEEVKTYDFNKLRTLLSQLNASEIGSIFVGSTSQSVAEEIMKIARGNC
ncbi:MAG: ABC transporter substrate-binding protein [Bacteroidia bacterium]|nr:ABC transporter substrate-binding protein [Bacteroidia bacterium]